jgi:hypothetical protein
MAAAADSSTSSTTSWVVTQQGLPNFATVLNHSLPQFLQQLQKASDLSAKKFSRPAFAILQRPVRVSVFVLAVANSPTVFYLHQEGIVRISSFINFAIHQVHTSYILFNITLPVTSYYITKALEDYYLYITN